jgi:hypothetical protein
MSFLKQIVLFSILSVTVSGIYAQQIKNRPEDVYGYDPLLYNGRYYNFFPPLNTGGTQYLISNRYETGSVTIRGVTYTDLMLNYDIYNQQLVLQYKSNSGAPTLIILSEAWLESFRFKELNFELITTQDTLKRIFQVLGTGHMRILYYWKKNLNLDSFLGSKNHVFSPARKEMYLSDRNKILIFRNNKTFLSLFGPDKRITVKEFVRSNNINIKKENDLRITELIDFCNSLYKK